MEHIRSELKKLVVQRLEIAFNRLSVILNDKDKSGVFNTYVTLHSQFNETRKKFNQGYLNNSQYTEERNKLTHSVIELISELEMENVITDIQKFPHTSANEMPWEIYWDQVEQVITILKSSKTYIPELIIGISNGGLFLADTISRMLYPTIPLVCLWANRTDKKNEYFQNKCNKNLKGLVNEVTNILIVDDSILKADTFIKAKDFLSNQSELELNITYVPLFTRYQDSKYLLKIIEDTIWRKKEIIGKDIVSNEEIFAFLKTEYSHFPYEKIIPASRK